MLHSSRARCVDRQELRCSPGRPAGPAARSRIKLASLSLKSAELNRCVQSGRGSAIVKDDVAGAQRSGAQSTPSFYIEGGMMAGAQPIQVFRYVLDSMYQAKTKKP